jgi:TetR/AcrR family transcriptional regulator, transcriptional repressor for nem operon
MTSQHEEDGAGTSTRILDIAERLVQVRGFNAFSYADIAKELGITKASLHYHYPGKAELGAELITRYTTRFGVALAAVDVRLDDPRAKLDAFAELYADVLRGQRMCLCGMLAAEYQTLPKTMQDAVLRFFNETEAWLARVLREGQEQEALHLRASPEETAQMIVGTLEGAMLIARSYGDINRFEAAASQLFSSLVVDMPRPGS